MPMAARRLLFVRKQLRLSGTTERLRASVRALTDAGWEVHVLARPGVRSREVEEAGAVLHAGDITPAQRRSVVKELVKYRAEALIPVLVESLRDSESLHGCAAVAGLLAEINGRTDADGLDFQGWIAWWGEETMAPGASRGATFE